MAKARNQYIAAETPKAKKALRDFQFSIIKNIGQSIAELNEKIKNPKLKASEVFVIATIIRAIKEGDPKRFEYLLSRVYGNLDLNLNVKGAIDNNVKVVVTLGSNGFDQLPEQLPERQVNEIRHDTQTT